MLEFSSMVLPAPSPYHYLNAKACTIIGIHFTFSFSDTSLWLLSSCSSWGHVTQHQRFVHHVFNGSDAVPATQPTASEPCEFSTVSSLVLFLKILALYKSFTYNTYLVVKINKATTSTAWTAHKKLLLWVGLSQLWLHQPSTQWTDQTDDQDGAWTPASVSNHIGRCIQTGQDLAALQDLCTYRHM